MCSLTTYQQLQQSTGQYCGHASDDLSIETTSVCEYPWIFDGSCIHESDRGKYATENFETFVFNLFTQYILEKNDDHTKSLNKILSNRQLLTKGLIADTKTVIHNFQENQEFTVPIPALSALFKFKRFGKNYGMAITGMKTGDYHDTITKILNGWMITKGWIPSVRPFTKRYTIIVDKSFGYQKSAATIDLYSALESIRKYVPWINWFESDGEHGDSFSVAKLVDQWNTQHKGITLGKYKDVPIQGRLLYGEEKQMLDFPWRKGVAPNLDEISGLVSFLHANPGRNDCDPRIELSISAPGFTGDSYSVIENEKTDCYQQQFYMEDAANKILMGLGEYPCDSYYC